MITIDYRIGRAAVCLVEMFRQIIHQTQRYDGTITTAYHDMAKCVEALMISSFIVPVEQSKDSR